MHRNKPNITYLLDPPLGILWPVTFCPSTDNHIPVTYNFNMHSTWNNTKSELLICSTLWPVNFWPSAENYTPETYNLNKYCTWPKTKSQLLICTYTKLPLPTLTQNSFTNPGPTHTQKLLLTLFNWYQSVRLGMYVIYDTYDHQEKQHISTIYKTIYFHCWLHGL